MSDEDVSLEPDGIRVKDNIYNFIKSFAMILAIKGVTE